MSEEKLKIFKDNEDKYHFKTKDNHHIDIEHKNNKLKFKLHKWDKETSLEVFLDIVEADTHTFLGNKIEIEDSKNKLRVYPIDTRSTGDFYGDSFDDVQCHEGGLRFELVLKEKPVSNYFTLPVASNNLSFVYQTFLTQNEIDEGVIRPLNVEGSYAVYHISKNNNKYMAGKAFHVYRPIAEDALENKAWCNISFDKSIDPTSMTVMMPQQFLDESTYPIVIDPDFGYTAIGGSRVAIGNNGSRPSNVRRGSAWTMPAGGPYPANYIRAYLFIVTNQTDVKAFINQRDSGGVGTHAQIAVKENLNNPIATGWVEFTLSGEILTSGVNYILNMDAEQLAGTDIAFDLNGTIDAYTDTSQTYCSEDDPWVRAAELTKADYSIFVNYGAAEGGGAGAVVMGTDSLILDLLLEGVI